MCQRAIQQTTIPFRGSIGLAGVVISTAIDDPITIPAKAAQVISRKLSSSSEVKIFLNNDIVSLFGQYINPFV